MQLNYVQKLGQVPRSGLNNALVQLKGCIIALITDNNAIYFYEYIQHLRELRLRDQIVFSSPLIEIESLALSTDKQWLIIATSTALMTLTDATRPTVHIYKVLDLASAQHGSATRSMFSAVTSFPVYFQPKTVAATATEQQELVLAVGGGNGVELFRYSPATNQVTPMRLLHDSTSINHVTFDAEGRYLGIVAADGHVGLWSRAKLMASEGHIDWFDHVTSERVTHVQFSPGQRPLLGLTCWDGQLFLYARDQHDGTWQHVPLNLLLPPHEKDTNNPGGFIQFTPSGRHLVTCSRDHVILSDASQNACHQATRLPLKDTTDCVKGLALVGGGDLSRAVLVLTRARDVYSLALPLTLSISGDDWCLAKSPSTELFLQHTADWRHSPLQLSVRHSDGRHVSFACPHVSHEMLGAAVTCAVTHSHVVLAVGTQLFLYELANDTWRDIPVAQHVLGVCFMNDHVVALLDNKLVTWQLSSLLNRTELKIDSAVNSLPPAFLLSRGQYCCVAQWLNDTCHLQFFAICKTGLTKHSTARYDHVTAVRYIASSLKMTCVNGESRQIEWP
jgi:hypothetical protein